MKLKFLWKTSTSQATNCPAIYKAENGDYVVQGWKLDGDTHSNLVNVGDNETAVRVPADVIVRIKGMG